MRNIGIYACLLGASFVLFSSVPVEAQGGLFFRARSRAGAHRVHTTPQQRSRHLEQRYPRYYGGFHARYFDNLGIPSGDIGLRGNSLYASPW